MAYRNDNTIQIKSFEFALKVIRLYMELQKQHEYIISKQLLRSGTSIGANVEEAIGAASRKDFAFKCNISLKEARETYYWLRLLKESKLTNINLDIYLLDSKELINILTAIVKKTRASTN